MSESEKLLFDLFHASIAIPVLAGLFYYRKLNRPLRLLLFLFILSGVIELINPAFGRKFGAVGPLFNIYAFAETLICSLYFWLILPVSRAKKIIGSAALLFLLYIIGLNLLVPDKFFSYNHTILGGIGGIVLAWVFLYFTEVIKELQTIRLDRDPYFFINIGMLFCFSALILVYFGFRYLPEGNHIYTTYQLSWIARIIWNVMVAYGFYLHSKQWTQSNSISS